MDADRVTEPLHEIAARGRDPSDASRPDRSSFSSSTPADRTMRIASATLSAPRPPARITGLRTSSTMRRLMVQSWVTPKAPI